jgi:hypothetical protein
LRKGGLVIVKTSVLTTWIVAVGAGLLARMGDVHAAGVIWDLQDVTFADGGAASGWFKLDFDAPAGSSPLLDWDVTTSGGDAEKFETWRYIPSTGGGAAGRSSLTLNSTKSFGSAKNNFRVLSLTFDDTSSGPRVKDARHTIQLIPTTAGKPASYEDINATGTFRLVTGGRMRTMPQPSATPAIGPGPVAVGGHADKPAK